MTVYFNPSDPAQSFLQPGWGWIHLITLFVGIGVILAGIFLLQLGYQKHTPQNKTQTRAHHLHQQQDKPPTKVKHQRPAIVLIIVAVLTGGVALTMFNYQSPPQQQEQNEARISDIQQREEHARGVTVEEKDIILILKQYATAQKEYKSRAGHYTKNLQELTSPANFSPNPIGFGGIQIQGYKFSSVLLNGSSAMNYQQDFVIYAIPTTYPSTGLNSYAIGPKGIVIFFDNHGKSVTNATELRQWKPFPEQ